MVLADSLCSLPCIWHQVLLVVLRAAKRHVDPRCILSPEQLAPPGLDTSHLTSSDPSSDPGEHCCQQ